MITLLLALSSILHIHCSDEKNPDQEKPQGNTDISRFSGSYNLEPTAGNILNLETDGTASIYDRDGRLLKKGTYTAGIATLRIFFTKNNKPDAVYLLDDFTENGWSGRWGDDFKILYKR